MIAIISDRQTRYLSDAALIDRLAKQLLTGIRAKGKTFVLGGHTLITPFQTDPTDALWALRHRDPLASKVVRHADGTADVTVTPGIQVHIYPAGGAS